MADVLERLPVQQNVLGSVTTDDGVTVESNYETPEQLRDGLGLDQPPRAAPPTPAATDPTPTKRNRREDPRVAVQAATGRQKEAERRAEESASTATKERERAAKLEAELTQLRQRPAVAPVPTPSQPVPPPPAAAPLTQGDWKRYAAMADAPKPEQFTGETAWQDYQFAVGHFISQKNFEQNFSRAQRQADDMQAHAVFTQRLTDYKQRTPDFDRRFRPDTPIDTRLMPLIMRLDNAPEIMLYLSDHQDLAQHLATLQPDLTTDQPSLAQMGKIGELVGFLRAQSAAAQSPTASARPAPISQAHPPVKRISGTPPAAVSDAPPGDDATDAEHDAWRASHPRTSRRRRYR